MHAAPTATLASPRAMAWARLAVMREPEAMVRVRVRVRVGLGLGLGLGFGFGFGFGLAPPSSALGAARWCPG